jgi:hypothetical protein
MTNTPPLHRFLITFFLLLTLGIGLAALLSPDMRAISYAPARDMLLPDFYLNAKAAMPVRLAVAAPPSLADWLKSSAVEFQKANPLFQVDVTVLRGGDAAQRLNTVTGLPDVWIAEAEFVRAQANGVAYETQGTPIAMDYLVWTSQLAHRDLLSPIDWESIAAAVRGNSQFRLALPPLQSAEGMAACLSASASFHHATFVTADQLNDPAFQAWIKKIRGAATDLARNPRDLLSTRPPQADAGLIMHTDWPALPQDALFLQTPHAEAAFRFPLYIRTQWQTLTPDEADAHRAAAQKLRSYLLSGGPQNALAGYGLGRSNATLEGEIPSPDEAATRALLFCWRN